MSTTMYIYLEEKYNHINTCLQECKKDITNILKEREDLKNIVKMQSEDYNKLLIENERLKNSIKDYEEYFINIPNPVVPDPYNDIHN